MTPGAAFSAPSSAVDPFEKLRPIDQDDDVTVSWNASQLFMHDDHNPQRNKLAAVAVDSGTAQHLAKLCASAHRIKGVERELGETKGVLERASASAAQFEQQRDNFATYNARQAETIQSLRAELRDAAKQLTAGASAEQVSGLQRKINRQAAELAKLQSVRTDAVTSAPEYQALKRDLDAQVQLTEREAQLRKDAPNTRALQHFYELCEALNIDSGGETWATVRRRVAHLRENFSVPPAESDIVRHALHLVRRLNTMVGQPDAKSFTREAATQVVNDVLELLTQLRESKRDAEAQTDILAGEVRRLGESRDEIHEQLTEAKSINAHVSAENLRLRERIADAEAAAGWREQCGVVNNPDVPQGVVGRHVCQRANGHPGLHDSDVASGEGRKWSR